VLQDTEVRMAGDALEKVCQRLMKDVPDLDLGPVPTAVLLSSHFQYIYILYTAPSSMDFSWNSLNGFRL
jgi:hypothetical protein